MFFLGSRTFIYIAIIAIISVTVGGFFAYQRSIINSLENRIQSLQIENENLKSEIQALVLENSSLKNLVDKKEKEKQQVIKEYEKLSKLVNESQKRIEDLRKKLADKERNERIRNILKSRKRDLLLKYLNKNVECWIENFERTDGRCVAGKWRPNKGDNK